jgi:hypothetical protein
VIAFIFAINFVISWFNAWACGTTWDSTAAKGGAAHFMNWMGAIMSASGFTWCYLVVLGLLGSITPAAWVLTPEEGQVIEGMLLQAESLQAFYDLGYAIIILPILGSGLAITVQTWRGLARRRAAGQAGAGDYAITGWNTFAQVHNTYSAMRNLPGVFDRLGGFFGGSGNSDSKDSKGIIVIVLVILAVCGGILTTFSIIQARRRAVILEDYRRTVMSDTVAA